MKNIYNLKYKLATLGVLHFRQKLWLILVFIGVNLQLGAQSSVKFIASPASTTVNVGQTFNVTYEAQFTGTPNLNSVQLILNFNAAVLEVVSVTPNVSVLQNTFTNTFNNGSGRIQYAGGVAPGNSPVNTNFIIATIQFRAIAPATNTMVDYVTNGNPRTAAAGGPSGAVPIWDATNSTKPTITINCPSPAPEINLLGNGMTIADGDLTPSLTDHTDFGDVPTSPFARTFTIQNTGATNLTINGILTAGDVSQFSIGGIALPTTILPMSSTTFTVTFTPTSLGVKSLTISIQNNDCNESVYDFKVQAKGDTYLPVDLLDFNGRLVHQAVVLDWVTASEQKNAGFEVQRSADNRRWQVLGFVKGFGNSTERRTYQYTDPTPLPGANYYRLRQLDWDDQATIHRTITVWMDGKNLQMSIAPNPAYDQLTVQLTQPSEEAGVLQITDLLGRVLLTAPLPEGFTTGQLDLGVLPAGTYIFIAATKKNTYRTKFVKSAY